MNRRYMLLAALLLATLVCLGAFLVVFALLAPESGRTAALVRLPDDEANMATEVRFALDRVAALDVDVVYIGVPAAREIPRPSPTTATTLGDPPVSEAPATTASTAPSAPESLPRLRVGTSDPAVTYLESLLIERGLLSGVADEVFDAPTDEAIRAFQRASSPPDDGIVGRNTWRALQALPPTTTTTMSGATTTTTQTPPARHGAPLLPADVSAALDNSVVPTAVVVVVDDAQLLDLLNAVRVVDINGTVLAEAPSQSRPLALSMIAFVLSAIVAVVLLIVTRSPHRAIAEPGRVSGTSAPSWLPPDPEPRRPPTTARPPVRTARSPTRVTLLAEPPNVPSEATAATSINPTGYVAIGTWLLPAQSTGRAVDPNEVVTIETKRKDEHGEA